MEGKNKQLNFCVVGAGFIFPRHAKAIHKLGHKIVLLCDNNPEILADFTDWVEMYNSLEFKKVDVVTILTPNYLHGVMVREALLRGKKVLCEKPICIDIPFGLEGANTVLQLRYNPEVKKLKETLPKNSKIDIKVVSYRDPEYFESWKMKSILSGGILFNMGVHYLDLLIYLLGKEKEIKQSFMSETKTTGNIVFENGIGSFHIELKKMPIKTIREITVNGDKADIEGATIPLSDSNNPDYFDLHLKVYEDFIAGNGITAKEGLKSINLAKKLLDREFNLRQEWNTASAKNV